jgi:hypothetical protein
MALQVLLVCSPTCFPSSCALRAIYEFQAKFCPLIILYVHLLTCGWESNLRCRLSKASVRLILLALPRLGSARPRALRRTGSILILHFNESA